MYKKLAILVVLAVVALFGFARFYSRGQMSAEELIALSKSNPRAFDEYVQARINAIPASRYHQSEAASAKQTPMTSEELIELSKTDPQALTKFLNSHVQDEHNEVDKLLNFLAHGKYE